MLLGAVEAFDVVSPRLVVGPPVGFAIADEDRVSETPSSINLKRNYVRLHLYINVNIYGGTVKRKGV